jgi:hypothetical protein
MSYNIVFDRQFIKTKDERFIPMALVGDSSLTVMNGRYERMSRSWGSLTGTNLMTQDELLGYYKTMMDNHMEDYDTGKDNILWGMGFRIQGKSTYDDLLNFIKTSCKKAITFEQLAEAGYSIGLTAYHDYGNKLKVENGAVPFDLRFKDEEEFINKLSQAKGKYKTLMIVPSYWSEEFGKEMRNKYFPRNKRQKVRRDVNEFYTVKVSIKDSGYKNMYLVKHTSRSTKMDYVPYLKYLTEAEAQKVVDKFNKKYGPRKTYKVEKVERPATIIA